MRFILLSFLFILGVNLLSANQVTLSPGSLLFTEVDLTDFSAGNFVTSTKNGSVLSMGHMTGLSDIPEGVTVLNGSLYISDGAGVVNHMDLSTGAVSSSFSTGTFALDALGSLNGNLIAMTFYSTAIGVYSTSGLLQQSINLSSLPLGFAWDGLASDGTFFYLADYYSDKIFKYSSNGVALGSFASGANSLTGLSFDASNNSLWLCDLSNNSVIDLSTSGVKLNEVSLGSFRATGGVAVVPNSLVPEPGYAVVCLGAAFLLITVRHFTSKPSHQV